MFPLYFVDAYRYRYYSSIPEKAVSPNLPSKDVPHVTILRPVKGLEPQLYECLAATFRQTYPKDKLTIYFCISSRDDPAFSVLKQLEADFKDFDCTVFVEEEDPNLKGADGVNNLGPNPKIRNMSRGYREAKGDIIWIVDCNVWVSKGVAGRMVDKLCGFGTSGSTRTPYKFVHLLPLVVDSLGGSAGEETRGLLDSQTAEGRTDVGYNVAQASPGESATDTILRAGGGRLEEMFMASSHAKFYTAINTVGVAPCIVGKSNMFRKSHLDSLTSGDSRYSPGIDYFSENICEDHLFGDSLWRLKVPEEKMGRRFLRHGLVFGDLAIQPMAGMSVKEYIARRVRWLRVRKWTVMLATFVEPGVEPLLCSAYGAFAVTTLPWFNQNVGMSQTWLAFALFWVCSVATWMILDSFVYAKLHSGSSIELDDDTPSFARPHVIHGRRPPGEWVMAWLGRELLALPIWTWACYGGTTVMWRGKKFRVGLDMKVKEIESKDGRSNITRKALSRSSSKNRQD